MFRKCYVLSDGAHCCFSEATLGEFFFSIGKPQDPAAACLIFIVVAAMGIERCTLNVYQELSHSVSVLCLSHYKCSYITIYKTTYPVHGKNSSCLPFWQSGIAFCCWLSKSYLSAKQTNKQTN